MNIEEKYEIERDKIRLKYWKMFRLLFDEIREEKRKYIMKKNNIKEKYEDLENPELLLENI